MADAGALRQGARRKPRALITIALAALIGLGLSACQTGSPHGSGTAETETVDLPALSELTPLDDPTSYVGPTTALVGGPSVPTLDPVPTPELPITVTSHDRTGDVDVTVEDVSRIVPISLSGSVGEIVYALGLSDNIVGRDVSTTFPGSDDVPVITRDGHSLDAEGVLALNPSVIVTDGSIGPLDVVLQMRDAGIPVVMVEPGEDPESSFRSIQQIADALGVGHAAPGLIDMVRDSITEKEAEIAQLLPADESKRPRVAFLYIRGTAGVFYLFGEGTSVPSLLESVGAVDAAAEIGWEGSHPMTEEALVGMDPDIILVMTKGLESAGGVDGLLEAQPSIALTTAGQNRRIIDIEDTAVFAGGTRIPDVIDGLARAIYAPESLQDLQELQDAK